MTTATEPRTWTKAAEIAWLKNAIATLGPHSYLGPWLSEYYAAIVCDMQTDWTPTAPFPSQARREAQETIAAAKAEAIAILDDARAKATRIETETAGAVRNFRDRARRELERLAAAL